MGLRAHIYKHRGETFSNGGLSETADEVTIVNIEGGSEPTDEAPAVMLVRGNLPNTAKIVPATRFGDTWIESRPEGVLGPMHGGSVIGASDQRLGEAIRRLTGSYEKVVPLHDRFETQELYNSLSR